MTYQVKYSESTNSAKPAITVEDKNVNKQTSLSFVGQNYTGYASIIAENFLHLLENFAKSTAPDNPVEGQIWYDNTTSDSLLKVYDGSNWVPTGAVTKSATEPTSNSSNGDLWVNPITQQLYIFSGISWSLIGPQFSGGLKTGAIVDSVSDTVASVNDAPHNIISFYSNNERIAILSSDTFVPKSFIKGFATVNRGITLTTEVSSTVAAKLVGTATAADSLNVSNVAVNASNFLRSDVKSTTNNVFEVKSNSGLTIGGDLSFNIGIDSSVITQTSLNKNIQFRVKNSSNDILNILHIDTRQRIGINQTNPSVDFDVDGAAKISKNLVVGVSTDSTPGGITSNGTLTVNKISTFNDEVKTTNGLTVSVLTGQLAIKPTLDDVYDIGTASLRFKDIYATRLHGIITGNVTGNVDGNVSGSAGFLQSAASIKLTGDFTSDAVPYNGKDNIEIKTTISSGLITGKPPITSAFNTDLLLVFRNEGTSSDLKSIAKSDFLASVPSIPVGTILPFAGTVVPPGYLLCDGSEILTAVYSELFSVISYSYRIESKLVGNATFALPDLRGRFPLGLDSMDNASLGNVPNKNGSGTVNPRGTRNGTGDPNGPANRVHDASSKIIGLASGSENITVAQPNALDTALITPSPNPARYSAMNPFLTINYIIFTGKL